MKLKLPNVAEALVHASNERDLKAYLACFIESASIDDVGKLVHGQTAIADWFTHKDYEYQMEPTNVEESSDKIAVETKVTGTFEGSPMNFRLLMSLNSGLIQHLKITVAR